MKRLVLILFLLLATIAWMDAGFTGAARAQNQTGPAPDVGGGGGEKAAKPTLTCGGCHGPGKTLPYLGGALFHTDQHAAYDHGYHAKAVKNGSHAASCLDCHATNGDMTTILPASDPKSLTNRINISKMCGTCHGDKSVMARTGISNRPFLAYQESAHARAQARGNLAAAVCTDCHNSHNILPASDAQSPIFKANIPQTCARCHAGISTEFNQSVHGQASARGVSESPVCTDCHGIHGIKPRADARATLGAKSCAECHEGVRLTQEFGVASERVSSYEDSYHGQAKRLGYDVVADCASCHGVHNILPSTDPRSLISKENLVQTCGQCHLAATEQFALSRVHLISTSDDFASVANRWVRWIYITLIVGVIGFMILHNGLVWRKKALAARRAHKREIVRINKNQRIQHWLLLTSFTALVLTGFALAYPDSWLGWIMGASESFRRVSHRIAAVVMIGVGVYHAAYMLGTREGRQGLRDFMPGKKDFFDLVQNLRYYAGLSAEKPKLARFGYAEKMEYWAVVWGTVIMGVTGFLAWFKISIFGAVPRWVIDVGLTIHLYEAILATLAIIVWHLYHVIFDPDVYPLNWAVVDGRVSEEHYKDEHALDYEERKRIENEELRIENEEAAPAK
ncbi:MAG TPA: cytochrome c3 family protein [Blastocatellia bacterium]|nr:cytochrome c3 family protein [Blastocatellia bacterium]